MNKIILVPIIVTILVIGIISWALLSGDSTTKTLTKGSSQGISNQYQGQKNQPAESTVTEEVSSEEPVQEETLDTTNSEEVTGDTNEEPAEDSEAITDTEAETSGDDEVTTDEEQSQEEVSTDEEVTSEEDAITGNVVKKTTTKKTATKNLKQVISPLLKIEYKIQPRYEKLLPITGKISSGKETIYLEGTADGIKIVDKIEEPDIEIKGSITDLEKISKIRNINSLKKALEKTKIEVKSNTFKGATVITAIEEITDTTLVERSFIQKIIGTGISAATGKFTLDITSVTGNFVLNNLN